MQGDKQGAEKFMLHALKEAKKGFGERDAHVAAALQNVAEIYRNQLQLSKAEPYYEEVSSFSSASRVYFM